MNYFNLLITSLKKKFATVKSTIFNLLFGCSLLLNVFLFINLGNNIFSKLILSVCAGCIQLFAILCIYNAKKYFKESYTGETKYSLIRVLLTLITKKFPAIVFMCLYLAAASVSIGATYSFSLTAIYKSGIQDTALITNKDTIDIKDADLKAKDDAIKAKEVLREKYNVTSNVATVDNSATISDYSSKITDSESQISKLTSQLRNIRDQQSNYLSGTKEYNDLADKQKTINAAISAEQKNIMTYTAKKSSLANESSASVNASKKALEDYQKEYNNISQDIEKLNDEKQAIIKEKAVLIKEDQDKQKEINKTQYRLIAEGITAIVYPEPKEANAKNEITETQVRSILLAIFSIMMEVGIFVTATQETEEEKPKKTKATISIDKKKKKEETLKVKDIEAKVKPSVTDISQLINFSLDDIETACEADLPIIEEENTLLNDDISSNASMDKPIIINEEPFDKKKIEEAAKEEERKIIKIPSIEKEAESMLVTVRNIKI